MKDIVKATVKDVVKQERILFLYLATGGGHISAARAIAAEFTRRYAPETVTTHLLDGIPRKAWFWRMIIEDGYRLVTHIFPLLWPILYRVTSFPLFMFYHSRSMILISSAIIRRYIRKHKITRVVSLHFLMNAPLSSALKQLRKLDMPAVTVITDPFTCHPIWFFRQFTPLVVFSRKIYRLAKRYLPLLGIPSPFLPRKREIVIRPPIIHSKFNQALSPEKCLELKKQFNFSPDKLVILIAGGGEGLPGGEACLRTIAAAGLDPQIAFVCGRNISQYERVEKIASQFPNINIQIYGFVDFMYELMNVADIILTKAGPATIFESLILHKPPIIIQRLYGQEQGNVNFVVNNKLGWFITRPRAIMQKIQEIIEQPEIFHRTVENIKRIGLSNGTAQTVDYIMSLPPKPEKRNKLLDILYTKRS